MSESFARETINQLMEHTGPEETFADTERKLRQRIERLEAALREMIGIAETLYGKTIIARGQCVSVREAVFRSEDTLKSQSDEFAKQKGADHE